MSEWSDSYKNPQWHKKRKKIMARDQYTCADCKATNVTLNVHHAYYESGRDAWKYPEDMLLTLCDKCHKERHDMQKSICWMLGQIKGKDNIQALKAAFDLLASGVYRRMLGEAKIQQDIDCNSIGEE